LQIYGKGQPDDVSFGRNFNFFGKYGSKDRFVRTQKKVEKSLISLKNGFERLLAFGSLPVREKIQK